MHRVQFLVLMGCLLGTYAARRVPRESQPRPMKLSWVPVVEPTDLKKAQSLMIDIKPMSSNLKIENRPRSYTNSFKEKDNPQYFESTNRPIMRDRRIPINRPLIRDRPIEQLPRHASTNHFNFEEKDEKEEKQSLPSFTQPESKQTSNYEEQPASKTAESVTQSDGDEGNNFQMNRDHPFQGKEQKMPGEKSNTKKEKEFSRSPPSSKKVEKENYEEDEDDIDVYPENYTPIYMYDDSPRLGAASEDDEYDSDDIGTSPDSYMEGYEPLEEFDGSYGGSDGEARSRDYRENDKEDSSDRKNEVRRGDEAEREVDNEDERLKEYREQQPEGNFKPQVKEGNFEDESRGDEKAEDFKEVRSGGFQGDLKSGKFQPEVKSSNLEEGSRLNNFQQESQPQFEEESKSNFQPDSRSNNFQRESHPKFQQESNPKFQQDFTPKNFQHESKSSNFRQETKPKNFRQESRPTNSQHNSNQNNFQRHSRPNDFQDESRSRNSQHHSKPNNFQQNSKPRNFDRDSQPNNFQQNSRHHENSNSNSNPKSHKFESRTPIFPPNAPLTQTQSSDNKFNKHREENSAPSHSPRRAQSSEFDEPRKPRGGGFNQQKPHYEQNVGKGFTPPFPSEGIPASSEFRKSYDEGPRQQTAKREEYRPKPKVQNENPMRKIYATNVYSLPSTAVKVIDDEGFGIGIGFLSEDSLPEKY